VTDWLDKLYEPVMLGLLVICGVLLLVSLLMFPVMIVGFLCGW
jgi:hypothetical protein